MRAIHGGRSPSLRTADRLLAYIAASELDAGGARETERNENETGRAWRSTICVGAAQGRFPPAIRLSARAVRWIEADVMEWLRERVAEGQGDAEAVVH